MGRKARAWSIDNLTWPAKARNMAKIYAWVAGNDPLRPAPYGP
jgi:hypothetical protein